MENSAYLDLLHMFAQGTWRDYKIKILCTTFSPSSQYTPSHRFATVVAVLIILLIWQLCIYKTVGNAECLPQLVPDQVLKLKQLSMLTLAETNKEVGYLQHVLSQTLHDANVQAILRKYRTPRIDY